MLRKHSGHFFPADNTLADCDGDPGVSTQDRKDPKKDGGAGWSCGPSGKGHVKLIDH